MQHEKRYTVLKDKDIEKYLNADDKMRLARICRDIDISRAHDGKRPLKCVVVEDDWPEYGQTWAAIGARVDAEERQTIGLKPGLYDDLPRDSYF